MKAGSSFLFIGGEKMDLDIIENAIYDLENDEINADNVKELACLYIIRQQGLGLTEVSNNDVLENELNDILPYYRKYCDVKRRYQMHELPEDAVIDAIQKVCKEISDLIDTLYSGTDLGKERRQILKMLCNLYSKYANK